MTEHLIAATRTVIPACDVDEVGLRELVAATCDLDGVGAYKLGFVSALSIGLPEAVRIIRHVSDKPIIYDHQKAGTDIPDTGLAFARIVRRAGVDAVILFPFAGPIVETKWIQAAQQEGMGVIVGALMPHDQFLARDGGFVAEEAIQRIFDIAISQGVRDFVVPATKPKQVERIRSAIDAAGAGLEATFYFPGFGVQGGEISLVTQVAGPRWHAIVGRAIYEEADMRAATIALSRQMQH